MSQSPRASEDVEPQSASSPDENEQNDKSDAESTNKKLQKSTEDPEDRERQTSNQADQKMDDAYDFEVKEQDRWLPIANGESHPTCPLVHLPACLFRSSYAYTIRQNKPEHTKHHTALIPAALRCLNAPCIYLVAVHWTSFTGSNHCVILDTLYHMSSLPLTSAKICHHKFVPHAVESATRKANINPSTCRLRPHQLLPLQPGQRSPLMLMRRLPTLLLLHQHSLHLPLNTFVATALASV